MNAMTYPEGRESIQDASWQRTKQILYILILAGTAVPIILNYLFLQSFRFQIIHIVTVLSKVFVLVFFLTLLTGEAKSFVTRVFAILVIVSLAFLIIREIYYVIDHWIYFYGDRRYRDYVSNQPRYIPAIYQLQYLFTNIGIILFAISFLLWTRLEAHELQGATSLLKGVFILYIPVVASMIFVTVFEIVRNGFSFWMFLTNLFILVFLSSLMILARLQAWR
jgi:hypothetical protein